jgi:hypothetical protein
MLIELRVEQNGKTIFRAECDTERGGSFAQFSVGLDEVQAAAPRSLIAR